MKISIMTVLQPTVTYCYPTVGGFYVRIVKLGLRYRVFGSNIPPSERRKKEFGANQHSE